MAEQIKYSFDKTTLTKIGKGALIAGTGALALYILNAIGGLNLQNPLLVSVIAWIVPTLTNLIKEWMRGTTPTP